MGKREVKFTAQDLAQKGPDDFILPAEVASVLRVDPKTVTRWAAAGGIPAIRTIGGHRRFRVSDVRAILEEPDIDIIQAEIK